MLKIYTQLDMFNNNVRAAVAYAEEMPEEETQGKWARIFVNTCLVLTAVQLLAMAFLLATR